MWEMSICEIRLRALPRTAFECAWSGPSKCHGVLLSLASARLCSSLVCVLGIQQRQVDSDGGPCISLHSSDSCEARHSSNSCHPRFLKFTAHGNWKLMFCRRRRLALKVTLLSFQWSPSTNLQSPSLFRNLAVRLEQTTCNWCPDHFWCKFKKNLFGKYKRKPWHSDISYVTACFNRPSLQCSHLGLIALAYKLVARLTSCWLHQVILVNWLTVRIIHANAIPTRILGLRLHKNVPISCIIFSWILSQHEIHYPRAGWRMLPPFFAFLKHVCVFIQFL